MERDGCQNADPRPSWAVLEALLQYIDEEVKRGESYDAEGSFSVPTGGYVSVIKVEGEPILPPVMTASRREEMALYKRQAVMVEAAVKARARQNLLSRVQNVLDSIQVKKTPSSTMEFEPDSSPSTLTSNHGQADVANQILPTSPVPASASHITDSDLQVHQLDSQSGPTQDGSSSDTTTHDTDTVRYVVYGQESTKPPDVPNIELDMKSPQKIAQAEARSPHCAFDKIDNTQFSPRDDSAFDSPRSGKAIESQISGKDSQDALNVRSPRSDQSKVAGDSGISSRAPTITPGAQNVEETLDTMAEVTDISDDEHEALPADEELEASSAGIQREEVTPSGGYSKLARALKEQLSSKPILTSQVSRSSASTANSSEEMNKTVLAREQSPGSSILGDQVHQNADESADTPMATMTDEELDLHFPVDKIPADHQDVLRHPLEENKRMIAWSGSGQDSDPCMLVEEPLQIGSTTSPSLDLVEIDSPQNVSCNSQETQTPRLNDEVPADAVCRLSLLSRVEFSDGDHSEDNINTEPSSDLLDRHNEEDNTQWKASLPVRQEEIGAITPGPLITPDVSVIEPSVSMAASEDSASVFSAPSQSTAIMPHSQFATECSGEIVGQSTDACTAYTCSTDLGRYMAGSLDTIQSSDTTLPQLSDEPVTPKVSLPLQEEELPEAPATVKANPLAAANIPDLRASYTVEHPSFSEAHLNGVGMANAIDMGKTEKKESLKNDSSVEGKDNGEKGKDSTEGKDSTVGRGQSQALDPTQGHARQGSYTLDKPSVQLEEAKASPARHVRRGSYTLEHPSPALLQSSHSRSVNETTPASQARSRSASVPADAVTSSMEDLKLRTVQRKLDYGDEGHTHLSPGTNNGHGKKSPVASPPVQSGQGPVKALKGESEKAKQFKALNKQHLFPVTAAAEPAAGPQQQKALSDEKGGKEAHLHRYLETVNQMPRPDAPASPDHLNPFYFCPQSSPLQHGEVIYGLNSGSINASKLSNVRHSHNNLPGGQRARHPSVSSIHSEGPDASASMYDNGRLTQEQMAKDAHAEDDVPDPVLESQAGYLEMLHQQLLQQQQEQLTQLLAEQQRQQLQLQQQMLLQSQQFLLQSQNLTGTARSSGSRSSGGSMQHNPAAQYQTNPALVNMEQYPGLQPGHILQGRGIQPEISNPLSGPDPANSQHFVPSMRRKADGRKSKRRATNSVPSIDPSSVTSEELVELALRVQAAEEMESLPATLEADLSQLSGLSTRELVNLVANANISARISPSPPEMRPLSAPAPRVHFSQSAQDTPSHTDVRYHYYTPEHGYHSEHSYIGSTHNLHNQNSPVRGQSHSPARQPVRLRTPREPLQPLTEAERQRFAKLPAFVKGHLTRQLLRSQKVQEIIKTITDTAHFALNFQQESPIKRGIYTTQDKNLQERVLNQLTAAMYEIHEVFFKLSKREQMVLIAHTRAWQQERIFRDYENDPVIPLPQDWRLYQTMPSNVSLERRPLSSATIKAQERRRRAREAEASMMASSNFRPKSAPPASRYTTQSSKSVDRSMIGAIHRNYQHLLGKALGHKQGKPTSNKPLKDNLNRAVAKEKSPQSQTISRKVSTAKPKTTSPASAPIRKVAASHIPATNMKRITHVQDKSKLSPLTAPWK